MFYSHINDLADSFCSRMKRNRQNFERANIIRMKYPLTDRSDSVVMDVRIRESGCFISASLTRKANPANAPELFRCLKYAAMVNNNLADEWSSCFEVDPFSGQIRLRSFLRCGDPEMLTDEDIRDTVDIAEDILEAYVEGFLMILCDDITVNEAFETCRKALEEEDTFRVSHRNFDFFEDEDDEEDDDVFTPPAGFRSGHSSFHGFSEPGEEDTEEASPEPETAEPPADEEEDDDLFRDLEDAINQALEENKDLLDW